MKNNLSRIVFSVVAVAGITALSLGAGFLGARWSGNGAAASSVPVGLVYNSESSPEVLTDQGSGFSGADVSRAFENRFRTVASSTLPVVAEINVVNHVTQQVAPSPFDFFFGQPGNNQPKEREFTQRGLGSGVLVARDGETVYVLTNNHVAGEADEIEVVLNDDRTFKAELVGSDDMMDLALVSFQTTEEVPLAHLGNSDSMEVGDWVFAMGNPLGFHSTVTAGIVSAKGRSPQPGTGISGITSYIQTDAAINQGNSGGALVNMEGEVVGINTWIASGNGGSIGLGFAIPINDAKRAIQDFIESGSVAYSWLGVQTGSPGEALAEDLNVSDRSGAFVFGVYEDSPAGKAGIHAGDLITEVDGTEIADSNALVKTIANLEVGDSVPLTVFRDGENLDLNFRTERRSDESGSDVSKLWPGVVVVPITDDLRTQLELDRRVEGVVVAQVNPESVVGNGGLQQGDVVVDVNGSSVSDGQDFYNAIGESGQDVRFRVLRNGRYLSFGYEKTA